MFCSLFISGISAEGEFSSKGNYLTSYEIIIFNQRIATQNVRDDYGD